MILVAWSDGEPAGLHLRVDLGLGIGRPSRRSPSAPRRPWPWRRRRSSCRPSAPRAASSLLITPIAFAARRARTRRGSRSRGAARPVHHGPSGRSNVPFTWSVIRCVEVRPRGRPSAAGDHGVDHLLHRRRPSPWRPPRSSCRPSARATSASVVIPIAFAAASSAAPAADAPDVRSPRVACPLGVVRRGAAWTPRSMRPGCRGRRLRHRRRRSPPRTRRLR